MILRRISRCNVKIFFSREISRIGGIGTHPTSGRFRFPRRAKLPDEFSTFQGGGSAVRARAVRRIGDGTWTKLVKRERDRRFLGSCFSFFSRRKRKEYADEDFSRGWKTRASILKRNVSKLRSDLQRKSR